MIKKIFFSIFLIPLFATITLKDKLKHLEKGDYIVAKKNKTCYLFVVSEIKEDFLSFLEFSIFENTISKLYPKEKNWKKWAESGAKGHFSKIIYELDLKENKLINAYSFTKRTYLKFSDQNFYFQKLLNLKLNSAEPLKIGSPPLSEDDLDTRESWYPSLIIDGKKEAFNFKTPHFEVFETKWPKDSSPLSSKILQIYFSQKNNFNFPYWIQITTGHIDVVLQAIDSGKKLNLSRKTPP